MNRTVVNMAVDLSAVLLFLAMVLTGFVLHFPLPPGTNKSLALWGLTRHEWGAVHFWISLGFLAMLVVHVVLHWQWLVTVVGKRLFRATNPRPALLAKGLITALVLLGGFGAFATAAYLSRYPVESPHAAEESLRGQAVLAELARRCEQCHGKDDPAGGFNVGSRESYFGGDNPLAVPGKPAESPLLEVVSGQRPGMRAAARHKLPDNLVRQIHDWIETGAPWPGGD